MATLNQWVAGARPRTLPLAVAPVAAGTGAAYAMERANTAHALLALLVAISLQVGVNYANDYSDGIRGTDNERVGPVRLVGQKLAPANNVKFAAFMSFGFAALCGLALVALANEFWLLIVGVAAIVAAWKYTGGKNPYGYFGLGELFVFVFFGLVATLGTTYTQAGRVEWATWCAAVGVGAMACAVLVANNLRDIPGDREVGKRTLAVRMGERGTAFFYLGLMILALLAAIGAAVTHPYAALALLGVAAAVKPMLLILRGTCGRDLIPAIAGTSIAALVYGLLLGVGFYLGYALR
ncbi:1,4-dihydroxy-2-naphthoate polyprenyltransferase [Dermatophilaceae bacterium Sec6.4]